MSRSSAWAVLGFTLFTLRFARSRVQVSLRFRPAGVQGLA